jgi:AcrR family transcriptional regulator
MPRGRPSKKQLILDVAEQLFSKHGYQGTSIDLVVREAGVSKPTVYNNFQSKQALIQELILRQTDLSACEFKKIALTDLSDLEKVYGFYSHVIDSPFSISLLKIYYAESYKLNTQSIALCQHYETQLRQSCENVFNIGTVSPEKIRVVISIVKDALLFSSFAQQKKISIEELKRDLLIIGLGN